MKIFIGSDHRGLDLKLTLANFLRALGHEVDDLGPQELVIDDDYPDYAFAVAQKVVQNSAAKGIIICASGVGMDIAANKVKGARCGLGISVEQVKSARRDDNINCLAIASDFIPDNEAKEMAIAFVETEFANEEKHQRRLAKIFEYENTRYS